MFHSQDGQGLGTVTEDYDGGSVWVKWDNGNGPLLYYMGKDGKYHLTLAGSISEELERKLKEKERTTTEAVGELSMMFANQSSCFMRLFQ